MKIWKLIKRIWCKHRQCTRVENGCWCDSCGGELEYDAHTRNWVRLGGGAEHGSEKR